jgi:hypothetical protein
VTTKLRIAALLTGVALTAALAGCGGQGGGEPRAERTSASPSTTSSSPASPPATPTPTPSGSASTPSNPVPPTATPPTGPPRTPTDTVKAGAVVGTIVLDSTGPCYQLVTDEGRQYALYSSTGFTAKKGDRLWVQLARLALKIYCGPGEHASITSYAPIR